MVRRLGIVGVCVAWWLVGAMGARAESEGSAITAGLAAAKPAVPMTEARQKALTALDVWLAQPKSYRDASHIAYYQAAVSRALDTLEQKKVTSGVRIFQLYSSSIIVQTPETVFAFDLDQGPNEDMNKTPAGEGMPFCLTDAQIARIASLVTYSFHTHAHSDHIDFQLTQALLDAGKTVIVTEDNKTMWKQYPWAEKLTVLEQTVKAPVQVGPLKVDVLWDHQWGQALHTSGTPCDAFVVQTPGGVTVMTKGDINCGLQMMGWLHILTQRGVRVDVVVGSQVFWKGVNTFAEWNALLKPLWLPGHAWEFEHSKPLTYVGAWEAARRESGSENVQVLSWGEWIDVAGR
jgi:L-ascorbate metabolism protein UlaG (beta-lactamase superfamily)